MNISELLDDYAIEVAKKILDKEIPDAIYDDIAVVPVDNFHRDVYFINHPKYYCIKVSVEEAGFKDDNNPNDFNRNHFAA